MQVTKRLSCSQAGGSPNLGARNPTLTGQSNCPKRILQRALPTGGLARDETPCVVVGGEIGVALVKLGNELDSRSDRNRQHLNAWCDFE